MTELTHVSLFSGIGGIDLAAEWAGFKTILFVEKNEYCQKVLRKHWPGVTIIGDIRDVRKESVNKPVALITGGVPCQPASIAGKRKGTEDDRWLWPETFRVVKALKPTWCEFENVSGLLALENGVVFDNLLSEMESMGYETATYYIPACGVNAPHRRYRVFIVAHAIGRGEQQQEGSIGEGRRWAGNGGQDVADTEEQGLSVGIPYTRSSKEEIVRPQQADWWATESELGRVAHGIPHRVDRLRCLGNAVVPQQIFPILETIAMLQRGAKGEWRQLSL